MKSAEQRVVLVTKEELEIIQESLDFLYSSSIENPNINYKVFDKLFNRLYYAEFKELQKP